jgi:hypothetical protein
MWTSCALIRSAARAPHAQRQAGTPRCFLDLTVEATSPPSGRTSRSRAWGRSDPRAVSTLPSAAVATTSARQEEGPRAPIPPPGSVPPAWLPAAGGAIRRTASRRRGGAESVRAGIATAQEDKRSLDTECRESGECHRLHFATPSAEVDHGDAGQKHKRDEAVRRTRH